MSHDQNNKNCEKNKFHRCIAAVCHHKRDCTCPVERVDGQGQPMPFDYAPQERAEKHCSGGQLLGDAPHIGCICTPPQEPLRGWEEDLWYYAWHWKEAATPEEHAKSVRLMEGWFAQQIARAEELGFKKAGLSCKLDHENAALQARKAVVEEIGKYNAFILNEYQKRHGFTDQIMVAILTDGMNKYFPLEQGLITLGDNFSQESK